MKKMNNLLLIFNLLYLFVYTSINCITPQKGAGLLQCFTLSNSAERQGCQAIILAQQTIDQFQKKIESIKGTTAAAQKIIKNIEEKKQEMQLIKRKHGIESLEIQKKALKEKQNKISYKIYGQAVELYKELDRLYAQITTNNRVRQLIKEIQRLEQEVENSIKNTIREIQQTGTKIVQQTRATQNELNRFKRNELIPLEEKLTTRLLAGEVDQELDKVKIEIIELNAQLAQELSASLTEQNYAQIAQLQNTIERLQIMLKSINDPEELLKFDKKEITNLLTYP